jgi:hypothetical protein
MMPLDRMPSVSVGIIVPAGAAFDPSHHWYTSAGMLCAAVHFDAGGSSYGHIQGEPPALRELAAALVQAAELAEPSDPALAADSERHEAQAGAGGRR